MSVTAFAAGVANPKLNPNTDAEIDLSSVSLPQTVTVYGDGLDTSDPAATFTYQWSIVGEADPTPAAFLNDPTLQAPACTVGAWSNVRLFLVVTNASTAETSEPDPRLAPSSAFVVVRTKSQIRGIQKPAPGERDYYDDLYEWADALEAGVLSHTITDHSDVVDATGAELEALTGGSYAEEPAGTTLHIHKGADIDNATTTTRGVVLLEDTGSGKVIQKERVQFTAFVNETELLTGMYPAVVPQGYDSSGAVTGSNMMATFKAADDIVIESWNVTLKNGGSASPGVNYAMELATGTEANFLGDSMAAAGSDTGSVIVDGLPLVLENTGMSVSVSAGDYFGVRCTAAPKVSSGDVPGNGATITIHGYRQV
jgi:hypothetical protein